MHNDSAYKSLKSANVC